MTIHKCQGLSLDCAIVDLSDKVFSTGMAYVALSRVRSLSGLHLIEFHSKSLMVSSSCLKEVNRLREKYIPDLSLYAVPAPSKVATKRKLSGSGSNLCVTNPDRKNNALLPKHCQENVSRRLTKVASHQRKQLLAAAQVLMALTVMTVSLSLVRYTSSTSTILETSSGSEMPAPLSGWCTWDLIVLHQVAQILI